MRAEPATPRPMVAAPTGAETPSRQSPPMTTSARTATALILGDLKLAAGHDIDLGWTSLSPLTAARASASSGCRGRADSHGRSRRSAALDDDLSTGRWPTRWPAQAQAGHLR